MNKIIRTPTSARGGLTPEEQEQMKAHTAMWIARAMRTEPICPDKIVPAIKALYAAANLKDPRVVIVPSPRIMAFSGGFASAIWWLRKNPNNKIFATDATDAATYAATAVTDGATYAATYAATDTATRAATDTITRDATYAATDTITRAATRVATYAATRDATRVATDDATRAATDAAT